MSAFRCATHGVTLAIEEGPLGREHRTITRGQRSGSGCLLQTATPEAHLIRMAAEGTGRLVSAGGGRVQVETITRTA